MKETISPEPSAREISKRRDKLAFLRGFIRNPQVVGSVIPSSRFLERRIVRAAKKAEAKVVVELGPGTGGTTRAVLEALPEDGYLLALEIEPNFAERLRRHPDPRLLVDTCGAAEIQASLQNRGLPAPDLVFSGIPFSSMPREEGEAILAAVWSCLAPGGTFLAYQYRDRVAELGNDLFGPSETNLELLNIPPTRLYRWRKPADGSASVAS